MSSASSLSKWGRYMYSGQKVHVAAGVLAIGLVCALPFAFQKPGQHRSHADVMQEQEDARVARLTRTRTAVSTSSEQ
jgi:hypothetical protein